MEERPAQPRPDARQGPPDGPHQRDHGASPTTATRCSSPSASTLSHSYKDGNDEVFYTLAGEEYRCAAAAVEDVIRWKADSYEGLLVDGKLLTVNAPPSVVATVVETTPSINGVQSGLKDAVLDNGITVKVGMVINVGDKVRIDTTTLEYKERVS